MKDQENRKISAIIDGAEFSYENAIKPLELAAEYLKKREVLPDALADYLADALELACAQDNAKECRNKMASLLNLMPLSRRSFDKKPIGDAVLQLTFIKGKKRKEAAMQVAKEFGVSERICQSAYTENRLRAFFDRWRRIDKEVDKITNDLILEGKSENAAINEAVLKVSEKYGLKPTTIESKYPLLD